MYSPSNYIAKIRDALDILHREVPKAFVNLVQIFDITPLSEVSHGNFFCNIVTNMVCDCAKTLSLLPELSSTSKAYQKEIEDLVASGRYDTNSDFTVVLQPFFKNTEPVRLATGKHDLSYFAPDCFHFSALGTNVAGKSLWDNMLEPVGAKQSSWHLDSAFHCPPANIAVEVINTDNGDSDVTIEAEDFRDSPVTVTAEKLPVFKDPSFVHSRIDSTGNRKHNVNRKHKKNLKQIVAAEKAMPWDPDVTTYNMLDAPPSFKPAMKYSDLSGLPAKYTDPQTKLRYTTTEEYSRIKMMPSDLLTGCLALRKANLLV